MIKTVSLKLNPWPNYVTGPAGSSVQLAQFATQTAGETGTIPECEFSPLQEFQTEAYHHRNVGVGASCLRVAHPMLRRFCTSVTSQEVESSSPNRVEPGSAYKLSVEYVRSVGAFKRKVCDVTASMKPLLLSQLEYFNYLQISTVKHLPLQ